MQNLTAKEGAAGRARWLGVIRTQTLLEVKVTCASSLPCELNISKYASFSHSLALWLNGWLDPPSTLANVRWVASYKWLGDRSTISEELFSLRKGPIHSSSRCMSYHGPVDSNVVWRTVLLLIKILLFWFFLALFVIYGSGVKRASENNNERRPS